MVLSDEIAKLIQELIDEHGTAELGRNELAMKIGCAPSQINYVITSRFTPEQGYIVESRRGSGGYIRITRVKADKGEIVMHLVNSLEDTLNAQTARAYLQNLFGAGVITKREACIMEQAVSDKAFYGLPIRYRDMLRAGIFKSMLISLLME